MRYLGTRTSSPSRTCSATRCVPWLGVFRVLWCEYVLSSYLCKSTERRRAFSPIECFVRVRSFRQYRLRKRCAAVLEGFPMKRPGRQTGTTHAPLKNSRLIGWRSKLTLVTGMLPPKLFLGGTRPTCCTQATDAFPRGQKGTSKAVKGGSSMPTERKRVTAAWMTSLVFL